MKKIHLLMEIQVTPNEMIALNVAIHYYLKYFNGGLLEYRGTQQLLEQFQRRLIERLPTIPMQTGRRK